MQKSFDIRQVFVLVRLYPNDDLPAVPIAEREDLFRAGWGLNPHNSGVLRHSEFGHVVLPVFVGLTTSVTGAQPSVVELGVRVDAVVMSHSPSLVVTTMVMEPRTSYG